MPTLSSLHLHLHLHLHPFAAAGAASVLSAAERPLHAIAALPPGELLYAGRAAFLVFSFFLAALAFARLRRATERNTASAARQSALVLARLERLEALASRFEPRLAALGEQIEAGFEAASAGTARTSYPIAIRLARAGAKTEELVASCGLTRQEAELVARLHGEGQGVRLGRAAAA